MTTATVPSTTTSPTGNAVLVLSTYNANNKPMIVDFNGKFKNLTSLRDIDITCSGNTNEDLTFEYGDSTAAYCGCGATLRGEFWYFGGSGSLKRQVKF